MKLVNVVKLKIKTSEENDLRDFLVSNCCLCIRIKLSDKQNLFRYGMINQSGGSNVHTPYGVSHRSSFSLSHSGFLSNLP